ncbi:MAG: hypothetical protein JHC25_01555 [Thermodesulfobacterium sp.]|jgi:hypothetical protein|nr:hypothetical protein [Thermodesulfobacterium sp.]
MKIKIIIGFILSFVVGFSALAFNLPSTAKSIKAGKIKVGKVTGLEPGQRFHNIHNKVLGLDCNSCHISEFAPDYLYQKKYKDVGGMGHVDRGVCLGCHKANGPAVTKLYGVAEK